MKTGLNKLRSRIFKNVDILMHIVINMKIWICDTYTVVVFDAVTYTHDSGNITLREVEPWTPRIAEV